VLKANARTLVLILYCPSVTGKAGFVMATGRCA